MVRAYHWHDGELHEWPARHSRYDFTFDGCTSSSPTIFVSLIAGESVFVNDFRRKRHDSDAEQSSGPRSPPPLSPFLPLPPHVRNGSMCHCTMTIPGMPALFPHRSQCTPRIRFREHFHERSFLVARHSEAWQKSPENRRRRWKRVRFSILLTTRPVHFDKYNILDPVVNCARESTLHA